MGVVVELTKFPLSETHLSYFPKRNKIISIKRVDGLKKEEETLGGSLFIIITRIFRKSLNSI